MLITGLNLNNRKPLLTTVASWVGWDGTSDIGPTLLEDEGFAGVTDFDFITDSKIIEITRTRTGAGSSQVNGRKVTIRTITDGVPSVAVDELSLSTSTGSYTNIIYMGNNRAYGINTGGSGAGGWANYIIGTNSDTLTELDVDDMSTALNTSNIEAFGGIVGKVSDTVVVLMIEISGIYHLLAVDITGDSPTYGSIVNTGMTQLSLMGAGCVLNNGFIAVAADNEIKTYSISGTALTLEDTEFITADQARYYDMHMQPWGDDGFVLQFEETGATDNIRFGVYDATGGTITRRNTEIIIAGESQFNVPFNKGLTQVSDNEYIFVAKLLEDGDDFVSAQVITVNPSTYDITAETERQLMNGDHVAIKAYEDGAKVLCCSQDNSTTPKDKINYTTMVRP